MMLSFAKVSFKPKAFRKVVFRSFTTARKMEADKILSSFANDTLVSTEWLHKKFHHNKPPANLKIIDATWSLDNPNYPQLYVEQHIPSALFFDINKICDQSVDLPHMLPSQSDFEKQVSALGITNNDELIIYDRSGIFVASARVWWTFKVFGHNHVKVLDGGLQKWAKDTSNILEYGESSSHITPSHYKAKFHSELVTNLQQMIENSKGKKQIADARPAGRFKGLDPEPRTGLRGGHMPNSHNVPTLSILTKRNESDSFHTFLEKDKLIEAFNKQGIDANKPVATTCGSGVTASVLALGLHLTGNNSWSVYDGSWSEWGRNELKTEVLK